MIFVGKNKVILGSGGSTDGEAGETGGSTNGKAGRTGGSTTRVLVERTVLPTGCWQNGRFYRQGAGRTGGSTETELAGQMVLKQC